MTDKIEYVVRVRGGWGDYFLYPSTWKFDDISRAAKFPTREAAQEALEATRANWPDAYKMAQIVEVAAP